MEVLNQPFYVQFPLYVILVGRDCGLSGQRVVDSVLSYFDTLSLVSHGVEYEYNHKQTICVQYLSTMLNILYIELSPVQL